MVREQVLASGSDGSRGPAQRGTRGCRRHGTRDGAAERDVHLSEINACLTGFERKFLNVVLRGKNGDGIAALLVEMSVDDAVALVKDNIARVQAERDAAPQAGAAPPAATPPGDSPPAAAPPVEAKPAAAPPVEAKPTPRLPLARPVHGAHDGRQRVPHRRGARDCDVADPAERTGLEPAASGVTRPECSAQAWRRFTPPWPCPCSERVWPRRA